MRRYVFGFVNSHDFDVCRRLMSEDYVLHMGRDVVRGRDENYVPAVRHQMDRFPNLGFALHDLVTDGEWTALLFSEHGAEAGDPRRTASWLGVSIYRFDGRRLTECWVEQDHYSRRRQVAGEGQAVPPIAVDPWSAAVIDPRPATAETVTAWIEGLRAWPPESPDTAIRIDPGPWSAEQPRMRLHDSRIDHMVTSGDRAAFHATVRGRYLGGLPGSQTDDQVVEGHLAAFATVEDGRLVALTGVSNRVALLRQLRGPARG
ncbi:ester cyclase [Actinomadura rugatobispora]|uniref:Ester cyclase n=1 Tax=Actinomadura rugatobispora TaxID=1994 RepID=A0ABW0ZYT1_9ACTN